MLYVGDGNLVQFLEADEKYKIEELINKKTFKVSDTPLTYRQVNSLSEDKLLNENRKNETGWRRFSFKEMVYLMIINDLKKFGLKHEQMRQLWNSFFRERNPNETEPTFYKGISDIAIGLTFGQIQIILTVYASGDILYYDPNFYKLLGKGGTYIFLTLNDYVNELRRHMGLEPFPITYSIKNLKINSEATLTSKEKELIKIIRDKKMSGVRIKKKNGDLSTVYAEKIQETKNGHTSVQDIIKMLEEKDYQDISIVKRDGRIVTYKVEETIKL